MESTLGGHGAAHEVLVWAASVSLFVLLAVCLVVSYRRLSGRVELELAEAILSREIDDLDTG